MSQAAPHILASRSQYNDSNRLSRLFLLLKSLQPLLAPVHVVQHPGSLCFQRRPFRIRLLDAQFLLGTVDGTRTVSAA